MEKTRSPLTLSCSGQENHEGPPADTGFSLCVLHTNTPFRHFLISRDSTVMKTRLCPLQILRTCASACTCTWTSSSSPAAVSYVGNVVYRWKERSHTERRDAAPPPSVDTSGCLKWARLPFWSCSYCERASSPVCKTPTLNKCQSCGKLGPEIAQLTGFTLKSK